MTRFLAVAFVLLIAASAPAADLITIVVPLQFQGINPDISHVGVNCELQQSAFDLERTGMSFAPSRKTVLVALKQASGEPGPDGVVSPGRFAGGNYIGAATIVFTDFDFTVAHAGRFGTALCWFDLRGSNGTTHMPGTPGGGASFHQGGGYYNMLQMETRWLTQLWPNRPTQLPGTDYLYRWQSKLVIEQGPISPTAY